MCSYIAYIRTSVLNGERFYVLLLYNHIIVYLAVLTLDGRAESCCGCTLQYTAHVYIQCQTEWSQTPVTEVNMYMYNVYTTTTCITSTTIKL